MPGKKKRSPITLVDRLQMKRYALLYYMIKKKRIKKTPDLNSRLMNLFGYTSAGHFDADWKFLIEEEFIKENGSCFEVTKQAQDELGLLLVTHYASRISFVLSAGFIAFLVMIVVWPNHIPGFSQGLLSWLVLIESVALIAFGLISLRIYRIFAPVIPTDGN